MKKNQGFGLTALFLIVMAYALTGAAAPIGIHAECMDGIDNNGDGLADADDFECINYPFADGNGETHTPSTSQFTASEGYTMTAYDWWFEALQSGAFTGDPCMLNTPGWYEPGNDGSGSQYDAFAVEYCI